MKIRVKTSEDTYFLKILTILANIPPFNKLRNRELEVYSYLLLANHKYRNVPFRERNKLIFNHETRAMIAEKMSLKIDTVYNIISSLRKKKIIEEEGLIVKYILIKSPELTFYFDEE